MPLDVQQCYAIQLSSRHSKDQTKIWRFAGRACELRQDCDAGHLSWI